MQHRLHLESRLENQGGIGLNRCKSVDDVCENLEFCLIHNPARVRVFDNDKRER